MSKIQKEAVNCPRIILIIGLNEPLDCSVNTVKFTPK